MPTGYKLQGFIWNIMHSITQQTHSNRLELQLNSIPTLIAYFLVWPSLHVFTYLMIFISCEHLILRNRDKLHVRILNSLSE